MYVPSEVNIFTAKPEPLIELLTGIHNHKVALPDFQRPWIWEPEMVRDLIVSIAYRYPAGSLLTMPVTHTSFALRPFCGAGDSLKATPTLMVLDGQQRLTSLYQALYASDGVRSNGRNGHFYLDLNELLADRDGIEVGDPHFERALFYVTEEKGGKRVRYEGLTPVYELSAREMELAAGALPMNLLFETNDQLSEWRTAYLVARSGNDMQRFLSLNQDWERLVAPWLHRIRTYPFPVVELRPDMPLGAICHIFEKVNSTGVPLGVFDLCTAILWAQGFRLNREWEKTCKELAQVFPMHRPEGTHFLQGLSLLDSLDRKLTRDHGQVGVTCRKQDLLAMKAATVGKWWPVLVEGYKEAAKFLADEGVLSESMLPYSTLVIPLTAIFSHVRHRQGDVHVGAARGKVSRWFWCSVFSQRYGAQVETTAAKDFEQVVAWVQGGDAPDVVKAFAFRADVLQEVRSIRNAVYKGVLCLLARDGALDFGGGGKLSTALFFDTRQDHHHIFPLAALADLGGTDPRAHSIINRTLISAAANRSIGGKRPSRYVRDFRLRLKDGVGFDAILRSHQIDPELLSADSWHDFLRDRRERLRKLVETACGGLVQAFSD